MEKGQTIELIIEDMLDDGRAFGRCEGCAVFVSGGGVPRDTVRAKVLKVKKTTAEATFSELVSPSPDRVSAECPYFGECGGCTLQEMSYDAQKKLKADQLRAKLKRLGGIEDPKVNETIGSDDLKYYRNKAVFAIGPHGEVGFLKGKSHFVMDIDDCMLQSDPAMACARALRTFIREQGGKLRAGGAAAGAAGRRNGRQKSAAGPLITQMTVKTAFGTGEVMVVLETEKAQIPDADKLAALLDEAVYGAGSEEGAWSLESIASVHQGKCRIIAGKPTITEEFMRDDGIENGNANRDGSAGAVCFEISPQSFFQVNPGQMPKLYDKAAEYADLKGGETVLDLYCGAGTIGIWLLDGLRRRDPEAFERTKVIGIESVKPAVIDANRNSVINGLVNTRYFCGKAEEELPGMMGLAKLYKWNEVNERVEREPEIKIGHVDVAVLDPPRAGCAEPLLGAVAAAQPDRIVYVSCDPGTLARDIKFLAAHGYDFIEATPIDNFPMTSHIEVVARIQKKKA